MKKILIDVYKSFLNICFVCEFIVKCIRLIRGVAYIGGIHDFVSMLKIEFADDGLPRQFCRGVCIEYTVDGNANVILC